MPAVRGPPPQERNTHDHHHLVVELGSDGRPRSWHLRRVRQLERRHHRAARTRPPGAGRRQPAAGPAEDAAYLRSIIDTIPGPVVVPGHSYGGSVMSEAADDVPA
ncbi:alpha/beta fold hydrolase [Kocuria turfanensis]|uniref:alpha/beta fold hydrolase n=1 Tax=Kocuria turfanensis TaxID=388357 RepID=UPI004035BFA2